MVVKIKVSYPWGGIADDDYILNVSDNTSEEEINKIAYEVALDLIFDRGVSWDYEIIS